jgi:hypothetical protein
VCGVSVLSGAEKLRVGVTRRYRDLSLFLILLEVAGYSCY